MSKLIDIRLNQRLIKIEGEEQLTKESELVLITIKPKYVVDMESETPTAKKEYETEEFRIYLLDDELEQFIKALEIIKEVKW